MNWFKKHKSEIAGIAQAILLGYMLVKGFWSTYLWIWFKVGLPIEWYALVATAVLGIASCVGLLVWIYKTATEA